MFEVLFGAAGGIITGSMSANDIRVLEAQLAALANYRQNADNLAAMQQYNAANSSADHPRPSPTEPEPPKPTTDAENPLLKPMGLRKIVL